MASDSRLTLNAEKQDGAGQTVQQLAVGQTDSVYKTFLGPNDIGISTAGEAAIGNVPIGGFVESFMNAEMSKDSEVDEVAQKLLAYFKKFSNPPKAQFHVAGYKTETGERVQHLWIVNVGGDSVTRGNVKGQQGASWAGETDILVRLTQRVGLLDNDGKLTNEIVRHQIPWNFFTLQDAIDYAVSAVKVTIDSLRFQPRAKTVGGPIDVLVIKPSGPAFWVQRKELNVTL